MRRRISFLLSAFAFATPALAGLTATASHDSDGIGIDAATTDGRTHFQRRLQCAEGARPLGNALEM